MHMLDSIVANDGSACHLCRVNKGLCLGNIHASGNCASDPRVTVGEQVIEDQKATLQAAEHQAEPDKTRTTWW